MKFYFATFLAVFTLNSLVISQENNKDISEYKNQITFSPFVFAFSEFQLSYERLVSENFGVRLSGNYHYGGNTFRSVEGFKQEIQFKYFFSTYQDRHSVIRMHFSPYFYLRQLNITLEDPIWDYDLGVTRDLFETQAISGGILFGADFTFKSKFSMSLFFGGGIKRTNDDGAPDTYSKNFFEPAYSGVYPKAGFDFGFVF
ncbi:MAG: hypothetical protein JXR58_00010 [Bacteroidales bacterium]|nr:hypothetical protein [Bacteroidales bacterium]